MLRWLVMPLLRSRTGSIAEVQKLYRSGSAVTEQYVIWKTRLDPITSRLPELTSSSGTVLDLGCGMGVMANLLAITSPFRLIVGIDNDARKIGIARRAASDIKNVSYEIGDVLESDLPTADVVLLIDVLHYWQTEKQRSILARCAKAISPGGMLVFREGMRQPTAGFKLVRAFERLSQWLGHNPRGDGLRFESREFYLHELEQLGLKLESEPADCGHGSNRVMIFRR